MSEGYITPTSESVTSLLGMLYGEDLSVSSLATNDVAIERVATFINDENKLVVACVCDREFVAYSGAALSMIPSVVADEMVADNSVSEVIANNFYEVMNICTKLLMSDTSAHLQLDKSLDCKQGADLISTIDSGATKLYFEVAFPRYGKGKMAILIN